jgi:dTDP-4-amino-4,6-dideoxygalactose transaminase
MRQILEVCEAHDVRVVEDCAQSHGATLGGRKTGMFGDVAAFSFYPTKNLGALGDGGAVFTRDPDLADQVRLLRQYGWRTRYISEIPGRNSRLDEIQAAVLRTKLPMLDAHNAKRQAIAARYGERLAGSGLTLPAATSGALPVWHQYAVRIGDREELQAKLYEEGISCASLYPVPIHHQPAYLDRNVSLPITEKACAEVLCLPCHPGLGLDDVDRVCEVILR